MGQFHVFLWRKSKIHQIVLSEHARTLQNKVTSEGIDLSDESLNFFLSSWLGKAANSQTNVF